jgi:O-methyltransferase involved in polyketide biosynthesis
MSAAGTARKYAPRVPDAVDVTRPSIARIYDCLLYGKDNFAVDRAAAEKLMESRLDPRRLALANRAFLFRAVRFLAQQGIAQYLDLGSGLPTAPSVHEVARDVIPAARVVYVDHDPIVVAHNDALLATRDGVITIRGDIRDPDAVLAHEALATCLDFRQPVAMLVLSVLHFISHEENAPGIIAKFRERLAPGSYLAVSVGTSDGTDPEMLAEATRPTPARGCPSRSGREPRSWTCSTASTWLSRAWSACRSGGPCSTPTGRRSTAPPSARSHF